MTAFHCWSELLPEMQGEVGGHLDPFSRRVLAMTCKARWQQGDSQYFHQPYNQAAFADPQYMSNRWRRVLQQYQADYDGFFSFLGEWFEGLSYRNELTFFLHYLALGLEVAKACTSLWPAGAEVVARALYRSNHIEFIAHVAAAYPALVKLATTGDKLYAIFSATRTQPNIDLIIALADTERETDGMFYFYQTLHRACRRSWAGRALIACGKRLPPSFSDYVGAICFSRMKMSGPIKTSFVASLQYVTDLRTMWTFKTDFFHSLKEEVERVLLNEAANCPGDRLAKAYRDLRAPLQELFPELVHYTDWALVV